MPTFLSFYGIHRKKTLKRFNGNQKVWSLIKQFFKEDVICTKMWSCKSCANLCLALDFRRFGIIFFFFLPSPAADSNEKRLQKLHFTKKKQYASHNRLRLSNYNWSCMKNFKNLHPQFSDFTAFVDEQKERNFVTFELVVTNIISRFEWVTQ